MKCVIEIEMDNAAFLDGPEELSKILWKAHRRILEDGEPHDAPLVLRDSNGNKVGELRIE